MIGIGIGIDHPVLDGSGGTPPTPVPILLIVAGQSNAGKEGTTGQTPPARYQSLGLKIWNNAGAFVDYVPAGNPGDYPGSWGTEAEFTHLYRQAGGTRPVYLVKRAQGGTSLAAQPGDDWAPSSGEMFDDLEARVIAARAGIQALEGLAPEEITFWNQGESDIQDNARAAAHGANLTAFLSAFRARVSTGLFVLERTRPFPGWYDNGFAVRKGQLDAVAADGAAVAVDCDFPTLDNFTVLHPGPDWCAGIGARAHAVWTGAYDGTYGDILDAVPDAPVLADLTDQPTGTTIQSGIVAPQGFERDCAVAITGGEYRILNPDDGQAVSWTSAPGRIHKWQKIQLRQTTSASYGTATSASLDLGGAVSTWTVTTAAEPPADPATLFASGEEGAWYDPSDLATLFTDAGTTNVTADGQQVAQWNDKSGNGHHLTYPSGNRPTYRTDGTRHWLEHQSVLGFAATRFGLAPNPDLTVVMGLRMLTVANSVEWLWNIGGTRVVGHLSGSAGTLGYGMAFGNGNAFFNPVTAGEDRVCAWVRDAGTGYGATKFFLSGIGQTQTSSTNPANVPASPDAEFHLGGWEFGGDAHCRNYGMVIMDTSGDMRRAVAETWAGGLI